MIITKLDYCKSKTLKFHFAYKNSTLKKLFWKEHLLGFPLKSLKDSWQDLGKDTCSAQLLPEGSKGISSIPLRKKAKRSATDEYFQNFWVELLPLLAPSENETFDAERRRKSFVFYSLLLLFSTIKVLNYMAGNLHGMWK